MDKVDFLQDKLLEWYLKFGRKFPWRNKSISNYQKVIAEVLLQRTKAETVAKFYPRFVDDYPNWKSIAEANQKDIEEYLKPIGLFRQRAQRLLNLALEMVNRNGRLPVERKELESIPFMGQYIANAVELVVFNKPSALIDVNMVRVIERYFGPRKMADIRYDPFIQQTAYKITNHAESKNINWAILDLAALVCTPKNPKCNLCPVLLFCKFGQNQSN